MTPGFDEGEYRNLLADFPPRPIEDEAHLEETESRLWELLVLDKRTPAQETYLGLLSGLVRH